jgi:hypothetical protein
MGWGARDVAAASLWQLLAAWDGWKAASSSAEEEGLTDSEFDQLGAVIDEHPMVH